MRLKATLITIAAIAGFAQAGQWYPHMDFKPPANHDFKIGSIEANGERSRDCMRIGDFAIRAAEMAEKKDDIGTFILDMQRIHVLSPTNSAMNELEVGIINDAYSRKLEPGAAGEIGYLKCANNWNDVVRADKEGYRLHWYDLK